MDVLKQSTLDIALDYVKQGYRVYPLVKNTKIPIKGTHGFKSSSCDIETVQNWFSHDYNLGIDLTSKNILVVDIDLGHSSGVDGWETYKELFHQNQVDKLPTDSYIERTPNGGVHWFLSYPDGAKVSNLQSIIKDRSGIDVITTGVPVNPSSIDGRSYSVAGDCQLSDIKPAPMWVLDLFKPKNQQFSSRITTGKKYTGKLLDEIVNGAPSGERNTWLTKISGKMFAVGADPTTVYNMLIVINDNWLDEPMDSKEINTIFKSILKRESGV